MRNRVGLAMEEIAHNGVVDLLQKCPSLEKRHELLIEFLPEIKNWRPLIIKRQLIFYVQHNFQIDLGVCDHYLVDDYYQYCRISGSKTLCNCVIPQGFCRSRDRDNKPKYPELVPCLKLFGKY